MGMKWVIPGSNAKILAQAIHCLAKLGEDLYIEGLPSKLAFRTVNLSKTAFASFSFKPDFFSFYPVVQSEDAPKCQIAMKAVLVVFRFPSGMDKSVENCSITLSPDEDRVDICLKFKQGFVKRNKLQLLECDVIQASYEDEDLPSYLIAEAKPITDILASFQGLEITWAITNTGVHFRNFSELADDGDGLRSEVHLSKDDFVELSITEDAELTFCLAELRNILSFAEHIGCLLKLSFTEAGKPLFLIVRNEILNSHVVLATLGVSTTQSSTSSVNVSKGASRIQCLEGLDASCFENDEPFKEADDTLSNGILSQTRLKRVLTRAPFDISKLPGYDQILAPDSDEEM